MHYPWIPRIVLLRALACSPAVAEELLEGLRAEHASAAEALLERLGDMCATAAEALAEDGGDDEVAGLGRAAGKALGAAITSMGPAAVLRILPLTLEASAPPASCTSCTSPLGLLASLQPLMP